MVVNLTRYIVGRKDNEGDWQNGCSIESAVGEFVKFKDVEELLLKQSGETPLQQLQAKIAVIATRFDQLGPGSCGGEHLRSFYALVAELRQLSAMQ